MWVFLKPQTQPTYLNVFLQIQIIYNFYHQNMEEKINVLSSMYDFF